MWSYRSCETAPLVTAPVLDDVSTPDLARPTGQALHAGVPAADHTVVARHHHRRGVPWFRAHPGVAAAVVAASSLAVLALQVIDSRASDAIALLYVLPIGLAAVTFGLVGGLAAAAGGYLAFGLFALTSSADHVGPDGWVTRAAALFLLGGLLGRACDQAARAGRVALEQQRQRMSLEEQNRRYSEGIELSDSILQHIAAAKWRIEQGDQEEAARLLALALSSGQQMVSELLPPRSSPAVTRRAPEADRRRARSVTAAEPDAHPILGPPGLAGSSVT